MGLVGKIKNDATKDAAASGSSGSAADELANTLRVEEAAQIVTLIQSGGTQSAIEEYMAILNETNDAMAAQEDVLELENLSTMAALELQQLMEAQSDANGILQAVESTIQTAQTEITRNMA